MITNGPLAQKQLVDDGVIDKWSCFECNPKPIELLKEVCNAVFWDFEQTRKEKEERKAKALEKQLEREAKRAERKAALEARKQKAAKRSLPKEPKAQDVSSEVPGPSSVGGGTPPQKKQKLSKKHSLESTSSGATAASKSSAHPRVSGDASAVSAKKVKLSTLFGTNTTNAGQHGPPRELAELMSHLDQSGQAYLRYLKTLERAVTRAFASTDTAATGMSQVEMTTAIEAICDDLKNAVSTHVSVEEWALNQLARGVTVSLDSFPGVPVPPRSTSPPKAKAAPVDPNTRDTTTPSKMIAGQKQKKSSTPSKTAESAGKKKVVAEVSESSVATTAGASASAESTLVNGAA